MSASNGHATLGIRAPLPEPEAQIPMVAWTIGEELKRSKLNRRLISRQMAVRRSSMPASKARARRTVHETTDMDRGNSTPFASCGNRARPNRAIARHSPTAEIQRQAGQEHPLRELQRSALTGRVHQPLRSSVNRATV